VASPGTLNIGYSDSVSASNTSSYSIFSGSFPPGLSLNSSTGAITGAPTEQGSFDFVIRATGGGGATNTPTLTIEVRPPGKRFIDSSTSVNLTNAKRFDGTQWVDVIIVKRFDGTNWVDVSNT
jgi:hypothetical protein